VKGQPGRTQKRAAQANAQSTESRQGPAPEGQRITAASAALMHVTAQAALGQNTCYVAGLAAFRLSEFRAAPRNKKPTACRKAGGT